MYSSHHLVQLVYGLEHELEGVIALCAQVGTGVGQFGLGCAGCLLEVVFGGRGCVEQVGLVCILVEVEVLLQLFIQSLLQSGGEKYVPDCLFVSYCQLGGNQRVQFSCLAGCTVTLKAEEYSSKFFVSLA